MSQSIFYLIIAIVVGDFLIERLLDYLNLTRLSKILPEPLKGIYNPQEYHKAQDYKKVNYRFGIVTSSISFLLILLMLIFEGFSFVDLLVTGITEHVILSSLIFFAIIALASDLLMLPFEIYDTFVIEEKFGFNKTTLKTFILDKIKGALLAAILGGGLIALIIFVWQQTGVWFWVIAWIIAIIISVFFTMFYSVIIVPLFNKQTPLENGELKTALTDLALKAGFELKNIFVIDGSKRSTKANAYFTGFGPRKRIVLYDTLISSLSVNEIVAVLAHEIGHYKKRHVIYGLITGIVQTGFMLFLFSLLLDSALFSQALGVENPKFHIGAIVFGILFTPISFLIGIALNSVSRKNEYEADAFAASFGLASDLCEALKKLSVKSLSNLTPHPLYVFFNYSHPTLLQRISKLTKE